MNPSDLNEWAKKLIQTHKKPMKKLVSLGTKFLIASKSEEETNAANTVLNSLSAALGSERVERRCTRASGKWLSKERLVEIIKVVGIVNKFGYANKFGRFLYPEEAMYLLETNRLELFWNDVPLSIQQAYEIILNDIPKYTVYKNLTLKGFRLISADHMLKMKKSGEPASKKRCCSATDNAAIESCSETKTNDTIMSETFKMLKESGPKLFTPELTNECTYKMFLPKNLDKSNPDFNVVLWNNKFIDPSVGFLPDKTIVAYTNGKSSNYVSFKHVSLPDL